MKYNLALPDEPNSHFEIRNDAGMNIGMAFPNEHPFDGCAPVTLKDAENNARLWAAAPDLLEALEYVNWWIEVNNNGDNVNFEFDKVTLAIKKAKVL